MMLQPKSNWVLVKLHKLPDKTPSGIIIADTSEARLREGTVRAVGPGRRLKNGTRRPIDVAVDDVVGFFRENLEHRPGKLLLSAVQELEADCALINEDSILYKKEK